MFVSRLELTDFRNYPALDFAPGAGLNLLVGDNAQGKSNLLESLYALATTKSLRTNRDVEMVRFGAAVGRIAATVQRERTGDVLLELALAAPTTVATDAGATASPVGERKVVRVNRSRQSRITDAIGQLNVVLFSSLDLDIVRGEPEERRRFLNYEIAQVSPRYVIALAAYRRALEQRNRLLREIRLGYGAGGEATLEVWSAQIVEHGAKLIERRRAYLQQLAVYAADVQRALTDGRETLVIEYQPSFPLGEAVTSEAIGEQFLSELARVRRDEMQRGVTLLGPQRDEICFKVGENAESALDAKTYGSQGQQRTVALALRLAERQLIEEMVGEPPVVLLDDVLSDLDERRRGQIFRLALRGGQTFLTTTDVHALPASVRDAAAIWDVRAGTVMAAAVASADKPSDDEAERATAASA